MVLANPEQIFVNCNCGCDNGFVFKKAFGCIYVSTVTSDFYGKQGVFSFYLEDKVRRIKRILKGKNVYIGEAILTRKDAIELIGALRNLVRDMPLDGEEDDLADYGVQASLHMSDTSIEDYEEYTLELKAPIKILEVLRNKEYRYHEVVLTRREIEKFIKKAERFILL